MVFAGANVVYGSQLREENELLQGWRREDHDTFKREKDEMQALFAETFEQELSRMRVEHTDTAFNSETLERELLATQAECEKSSSAVAALELQLSTVEKARQLVASNLQKASEQQTDSALQITESQKEVADLQQQLDTACKQLDTTRHESKSTRNELESTHTELDTTRNELDTALNELESTRKQLESTRNELDTALNELDTTHTELDTTHTELESSRNQTTQDPRTSSLLADAAAEADAYEADAETFKIEVKRLQGELSELREWSNEISTQNEQLITLLEDANTESAEHQQLLEAEQQAQADARDEIDQLNASLSVSERELGRVNRQVGSQQATQQFEMEALERQVNRCLEQRMLARHQ